MTAETVMQSYENVKLHTIVLLIVWLYYKVKLCLICVLKVKEVLNNFFDGISNYYQWNNLKKTLKLVDKYTETENFHKKFFHIFYLLYIIK